MDSESLISLLKAARRRRMSSFGGRDVAHSPGTFSQQGRLLALNALLEEACAISLDDESDQEETVTQVSRRRHHHQGSANRS